MKKTNILFTCAGRRNYLINYFKEALDGNGLVLATDMLANAPALIDADIAKIVPSIYDEDYINCITEICKEYHVDAIISLNDLELPILAKHKEELQEIGVAVLISSEAIIDIAFDKWKTYNFLVENDILTPKTYIDYTLALEAVKANKLSFPLVLKPRWGSGSIGIEVVDTKEELVLVYKLLQLKLKKSILNNASKNSMNQAILIQEKINGIEYGLDVLNNFEGDYYGTFAREKLYMRSGETDKATSVIHPEITAIGETIAKKLKHTGNLDCDVFIANDKIYVLELNPRFGGGYPFSHEAGINTAAIYIAWLKGHTDIAKFNTYKSGITYVKCDRLLKINTL
ncbi:ATP-grasp domain-containing protein [Cellulophaga sp. 20_2_10]|uniref:ATP-grasp domain-containing protein n=1 Tax=Cellulophaga sp. 20_2_10 TaxID=2942476 RepID=UPI00201AE399|nr:ATP-grasp domain-containing protein [Cellulophaga sp. 20_2_10]MCL5244792.1 ATP-grasp domain-containing protein [Cellulophaga sp. 20_2_10]